MLAESILFSVIVPVYRAEDYLNVCVDCLRNQTYSNLEIILVDDGSPDACPVLCDAYAEEDHRVRVIHKENGGPTRARKAGAASATGDYVCCVDSDDYVALDYFERISRVINQHHPDVVCCGSYVSIDGINIEKPMVNRYGYYSRRDMENEIFPTLIQTPYASYFAPSFWAKAIKADIFKQQISRVDDAIRIGEDGACIIPCIFEATSMYILPECLYYYRENKKSLTKSRKAFPWDGPKLIAQHLERIIDLQQYDFQQQWYRKTVHELFTVVKSQFNRKENYFSIVREIKEQLREPIYQEALLKCDFIGKSGKMAKFALKHHQFWLVWLFNMIKK